MSLIHIGVLRGGPSTEHEVSLKTGQSVIENLYPFKYLVKDIVIDKDGIWHISGIPLEPAKALQGLDVVFNALHGEYGEDGKVQSILESFMMPYTGSDSLSSSIGMNKVLSKKVYNSFGIKTPNFMVVQNDGDVEAEAMKIMRTLTIPVVLKPVTGGSSIGVSIARDYKTLVETLISLFKYSNVVLAEEYIKGKEATCGVIEKFRELAHYSLPPIEIITRNSEFFDYDAKYKGGAEEICPGNFTREEKMLIEELAVKAHKALGLRHYSRSDFILHPKRGIFILETNTLPGLTQESLVPKALQVVGSTLSEFLDHLVSLALARK